MKITSELLEQAVFVASHPRSGTHLAIDCLRKNFEEMGSWKWPFFPASCLYLSELQLRKFLKSLRPVRYRGMILSRPIIKTHVPRAHRDWCEFGTHCGREKDISIIYVYRNPLNVMMSLFAYEIHNGMRPVKFNAFIKENNAKRLMFWKQHVEGYYDQNNICLLEYESLIGGLRSSMEKVRKYLGVAPRISVYPALPLKPKFSLWQILKGRLLPNPESSAVLSPSLELKSKELREAFNFIEEKIGNFLDKIKMVR